MKMHAVASLTLALGFAAMAFGAAHAGDAAEPRNLIVVYSRTGNTQALAGHIQAQVGGDVFQVRTATPYPDEYRATTEIAREEQQNNARPELAAYLDGIDGYDTIYVGFPNWWGSMPMAMFTFLERYDFSGKTVVPFLTHGGGGAQRCETDLRRTVPGATVLPALVVSGSSAGNAGTQVTAWLRQNNLIR